MVEINWLAVALATIVSMIVGSVWYAPPVFGNKWMKLAKITEKDMKKAGWEPIATAVVTSGVTAYVLAQFTFLAYQFYQTDYSYLQTALMIAFMAWLGFTWARFLTHDTFEGRPGKLTGLNSVHELVTLMAMAVVIGSLGV